VCVYKREREEREREEREREERGREREERERGELTLLTASGSRLGGFLVRRKILCQVSLSTTSVL